MTPENAALAFLSQLIKDSPFHGKVFVAGGFVRDEVMGRPSKDIDLVVTLEDGGIELANWVCNKLRCFTDGNPVTFPRFGTAKFNLRGQWWNGIDISNVDIEAVMTRSETYDGVTRKPDVSFASLWQDAHRRDFTVNSLFMDLTTGDIRDETGMGLQDIQDGVVRTAMDPAYIFGEDPLRMLRAIRFAVRFNWKLPIEMIDGLKIMAPSIARISKERIQDELNKILQAKNPSKAFLIMRDTGLLNLILPEIAALQGVTQNQYHSDDVFTHTMKVLDDAPAVVVTRLAALFHDVGKPATRSVDDAGHVHFYEHEDKGAVIARDVMTRLKYPNGVISTVELIVKNHMRLKHGGPTGEKATDKTLRKLRNDVGPAIHFLLDVMDADNRNHAPGHAMPEQIQWLRPRFENLAEIAPKVILPINGHDVIKELGLKPGPKVREYLDAVKEAWFENPNLSRDDALALIHGLSLIDR